MTETGVILTILRERTGKTQEQVADDLGSSQTVVSRHERGKGLNVSTLEKYADYYKVTTDVLLGKEPIDGKKTKEGYRQIPVVGDIACGEPILAMEQAEEYLMLPEDILPTNQVIALRMKGQSMERVRLHDGDLALIRMQDTIEDGEIAAVCVGENSEEATIKRIRFVDDYITLLPQSDDPQHHALAYRSDQVRVVGKVVGVWWG